MQTVDDARAESAGRHIRATGCGLLFSFLRDAVWVEDVADAMHGPERGQVDIVLLAEFAELDDILVERTAADIGMKTPD